MSLTTNIPKTLKKGLVISARSVVENLAEIIELPKISTHFISQHKDILNIKPAAYPHPIFLSFIEACANK